MSCVHAVADLAALHKTRVAFSPRGATEAAAWSTLAHALSRNAQYMNVRMLCKALRAAAVLHPARLQAGGNSQTSVPAYVLELERRLEALANELDAMGIAVTCHALAQLGRGRKHRLLEVVQTRLESLGV
eukprot:5597695-Amphidinium_carterae.1